VNTSPSAAIRRVATGFPAALRALLRKALTLGFALAAKLPASARYRGAWRAADVLVIAHRGASAYAPENSLVALQRALEQGARDVELDVQLSRDDELILFHDHDLECKTAASGRVRDHEAKRLLGLEIGSWFDSEHPEIEERFAGTRLNRLTDVFDAFGDTLHYHLELKSKEEELPRLLLEEITARGLGEHVTVTSFLTDQLLRARALDPGTPMCTLIRRVKRLRDEAMDRTLMQDLRSAALKRRAIDRAAEHGFSLAAMPALDIDAAIVEYARSRGLAIRAWRLHSAEDLDHAIRVGAIAITVDWPDRAFERLAAP